MKNFGIKMTLPEGDSMRSAHLLGDAWQAVRWYQSAQERDQVLAELMTKHPHYRSGDHASLIYSKIERDT